MSYAPEFCTNPIGWFHSNALRFATAEEAEHYATNLAATWEAVRDVRVVESSDPVNYAIVDGELKEVKP
jgi:hypothetical protein